MPEFSPPPRSRSRLRFAATAALLALAPGLARADEAPSSCSTVAQAEQMAIAFGAERLQTLTGGQWKYVSDVFQKAAAEPPPGDGAAMALRKDGSAIIYFLSGDRACAPVSLGKETVDAILAAGAR
jgi:hypothetical protein